MSATASGASSYASGGSFSDGFKFGLGGSLIQWGFSKTEARTNELKRLACQNGDKCEYNKWDELLTDGTRGVEYIDGYSDADNNWFTRSGMGDEARNSHMYSVDSLFGRYINKVSKVHDWMNSDLSRSFGFMGYSNSTGIWLSASESYNTMFQAYSLTGMPIAGAYTAITLGSKVQRPVYNEDGY